MKTILRIVLAAGLLAFTRSLDAQPTNETLTAIPPFLNTASLQAQSIEEAQLMLQTIEALPLIPYSELATNGFGANYWSATHLDWPPLPANLPGVDGWPLDDAGKSFLLNDLEVEEEQEMMHR